MIAIVRAVATVLLVLSFAFAPGAHAQQRLAIVATTTDLRSLVEAMGGERVQVTSLVPASTDAEEYQPRPQDLARLKDARLVVRVGLDYDLWLDALLRQANRRELLRGGEGYVDASTGIALLDVRILPRIIPVPSLAMKGKTLLVCGSATAWLQRSVDAKAHRIPTFTLPHDIAATATALRQSDCVLLGIGAAPHGITPATLAQRLAETVAGVLHQTPVARLLLEGGATSAAIIAALGWTRLRAEQIADSGVGVLRPVAGNAPFLFIKPGSYGWPDTIWP